MKDLLHRHCISKIHLIGLYCRYSDHFAFGYLFLAQLIINKNFKFAIDKSNKVA